MLTEIPLELQIAMNINAIDMPYTSTPSTNRSRRVIEIGSFGKPTRVFLQAAFRMCALNGRNGCGERLSADTGL